MKSMFGAVDRKGNVKEGKVGSYSPAWSQKVLIKDLNEEIGRLERDLQARVIPSEEMGTVNNEVLNLKGKMDAIVNSKPKYSVGEEKALLTTLKSLNDQVGRTLYSEYEQEKPGKYANPHLEADINDYAHIAKIEVNKEIAEACNVNPQKMKDIGSNTNVHISRNSADKMRRFICDYWDIPEYNREHLRKRNFEGRKSNVSMSNVNAERYDMAFGGENKDVSEVITELKKEVEALRVRVEEKKAMIKPKKETKTVEWKCEEEGCNFVGTTRNKGIHKALHVRQANIKAKKELAVTEG